MALKRTPKEMDERFNQIVESYDSARKARDDYRAQMKANLQTITDRAIKNKAASQKPTAPKKPSAQPKPSSSKPRPIAAVTVTQPGQGPLTAQVERGRGVVGSITRGDESKETSSSKTSSSNQPSKPKANSGYLGAEKATQSLPRNVDTYLSAPGSTYASPAEAKKARAVERLKSPSNTNYMNPFEIVREMRRRRSR